MAKDNAGSEYTKITRALTTAERVDVEARLAHFRAVRDWYTIQDIRARIPTYQQQLVDIESQQPDIERENRRRMKAAQAEHNPFMRAIKVKQATEAANSALAENRGKWLVVNARLSLCQQVLAELEALPVAA